MIALSRRKIRETALPEAVEFLKTLDHADLGTDEESVMLLRVTGHGAIRIAILRQIQDPQAQIEYLGAQSNSPLALTAALLGRPLRHGP